MLGFAEQNRIVLHFQFNKTGQNVTANLRLLRCRWLYIGWDFLVVYLCTFWPITVDIVIASGYKQLG